MKITNRQIEEFGVRFTQIGEAFKNQRSRNAFVDHFWLLHGNGLRSSVSDSDGIAGASPISGPEQAVVAPPDGARRQAVEILALMRKLDHNLAELASIVQTANKPPKPQPVPCPLCTPGQIHPGQILCDNEQCGTRSLHGECSKCGTQTNTAGPVKTRPIKGLCRPCYDSSRQGRGKRQRDGWFDRTELVDETRIIHQPGDTAA